ncbi:MAG TPA: hypothetical protein VGG08_08850 [Solirubrobacteraceae bacterium]
MSDLWKAILYLHLLAMAFFVGGQLLLAVAVVPAARRHGDGSQLQSIARRFGWGTLVAIGILLATGSAMASHYDMWGEHVLRLKLALVALLGVLLVWHMLRPRLHILEGGVFVLSLAIVWLGLTLAQG